MANPLVSVLLPTYNEEAFIAEALTSVVTQDYENLEVVVGDDGSTDCTLEVIQEYARKYPAFIKVVEDRRHLGITGNFNRILKQCRGAYIAILAGDDVYLPGKITAQVEWLEADRRRVLCAHAVDMFDSVTGNSISIWGVNLPEGDVVDPAYFVQSGHPCHPLGNMVRADHVPKHGFDSRLPNVSDWKFFVDCVSTGGSFGKIEGVYARYRRHGGNTDNNRIIMNYESLNTLNIIEREHPVLAQACRQHRPTFLRHCVWEFKVPKLLPLTWYVFTQSPSQRWLSVVVVIGELLRKFWRKMLGEKRVEGGVET